MAATAVELGKGLKDVQAIRDKQSAVFEQINKEQELSQFSSDEVPQHVLHEGYRDAFILAADEFKLVSDCLDKVRGLIKRRRDTSSTKASSSLAAVPQSSKSKKHKSSSSSGSAQLDVWQHDASNILPPNMEVAALIDKDSEPQLWILAAVLSYKPHPVRPRYTVVDLDPGDDGAGGAGAGEGRPPPKQYQLEPRKIIPLPSLRDTPMSRRREFLRGVSVLALFPVAGVTTFYRAEVLAGPRKRRDDKYTLRFDDDEEDGPDGRAVSAQYIAPYPGIWTEDGWL